MNWTSLIILVGCVIRIVEGVDTSQFIYNPQPLSSVDLDWDKSLTSFFHAVSDDNNFAFVSMSLNRIYIISLEDIQQPIVIGFLDAKSPVDMDAKKGFLYIADKFNGFIIYDMKDPTHPKQVYQLPQNDALSAESVTVTSDIQYAFVSSQGFVHCFDITDPTKPKELSVAGVQSAMTYKLKLDKTEKLLGFPNYSSGFHVIDVRNKDSIWMRGGVMMPTFAWDCAFTPLSDWVYILDMFYGLYIADITALAVVDPLRVGYTPLQMTLIFYPPQVMMSIAITSFGNHLLFGYRSVGLSLYELKEPNYKNLIFVQNMEGSYLSQKITISKDTEEKYAYVVNGHSFLIYESVAPYTNRDFPNIFNQFQSLVDDTFNTRLILEVICFADNQHIIVAGATDSVRIYSIKDPLNPTPISSIPVEKNFDAKTLQQYSVSYDGLTLNRVFSDVLYLGCSELAFFTYDITDLYLPVKKTHFLPIPSLLTSTDSDGYEFEQFSDLTSIFQKIICEL